MTLKTFLTNITAVLVLALSTALPAAAQENLGTPGFVDYQGKVFDSDGRALASGDTAQHYGMQFRIYTQQSEGVLVYSEAQTVTVSDGDFSVRLGTGTRVSGETPQVTDISEAFKGKERFLEVTVIPHNATSGTPIKPRLAFQSAPFSFVSMRAKHAENAKLAEVATTVTSPDVALLSRGPQTFTGSSNVFTGQVSVGHGLHETYGLLQVQDPDADTGRIHVGGVAANGQKKIISFGDGELVYVGENVQDDRMELRAGQFFFNNGNVGIHTGTDTPSAPLEVRGNIKLGNSGELHAASGDENLRILRGTIRGNGEIIDGTGWTVSRTAVGRYRVDFKTHFSANPSIILSAFAAGTAIVIDQNNVNNTHFEVLINDFQNVYVDKIFSFIAIGPR